MTNTEDFAALVSSRICHDLISPIGAIGNGVELLEMTGQGNGPELALISDRAESASARVRFFRIAFGSAKEGQAIGIDEISAILTARSKDGRFRYTWAEDGTIDRPVAKLLFLAILCVEHALPRGGQIRVARTQGGWHIKSVGGKVKLDDVLWGALQQGKEPLSLDSGRIQFAALAMMLGGSGRQLVVDQTDGQLTLTL